MAAAFHKAAAFLSEKQARGDCTLDKQIIYDKLFLQFHRSDERGAVVKSSVFCAKGAAAEASESPNKRGIGCWAAGEYVADCHESGALSSVRGGRELPRRIIVCTTARFPFEPERAFLFV